MELVLVGIGGALGSLARYILGRIIAVRPGRGFPLGTFVINITGAVLLGIVSSLDTDKNINLLLADGFLGAYTTFSTFMYEGFSLFGENRKRNAIVYIFGSLVLGIAGYMLGFGLIKLAGQ